VTDIVLVTEWLSERNLNLVDYTINHFTGHHIEVYLFRGHGFTGEPAFNQSWVNFDSGLRKALFYTDEWVPFWLYLESEVKYLYDQIA
jgi:hypothetical protein